mgnify:CR=1 FL=1
MMKFTESVIQEVRQHAAEAAPAEACGLIVVDDGTQRYIRCTNIARCLNEFVIDPVEYAQVEDKYRIIGIAHSHYGVPALPSQADLTSCEATELPWLIVNHPVGDYHVVEPSGYVAPLRRREFHYGVLDCFALVRDYYRLELGIFIPDFERPEDWDNRVTSPFVDNLEYAGFVSVPLDQLRPHDVLLMKCRAKVINHAAVFLGGTTLLQHLIGKLSGDGVYDGYWRKVTVEAARHRSLV